MVKTRGRPGNKKDDSPLPSDMEDEVDKFHKKRDKLSLTMEDDVQPSDDDSLDDEAVYDVSGSESDDSFDDDDSDSEADEHRRKLISQAKAMKLKLKMSQKGSDDEDISDDEQKQQERGWGSHKKAYYDADVADLEGSDEEEALRDEEEEALRLQREAAAGLTAEDFGGAASSSDDDDGEDVDVRHRSVSVEALEKAADAVDVAAARHDTVEMEALIGELRSSLREVRERIQPVMQELQQGDIATAEGVSYLEAKHMLLLHYAAGIVFYVLLKAEGRPVRDHPVITRLVELRAYLEKIRPIDKRLQYQIDKLLNAAEQVQQAGGADAEAEEGGGRGRVSADMLRFGPRPDALIAQGLGAADVDSAGVDPGQDGVYRPPRLNPVSMELEDAPGASYRERRKELQQRRQAARSTFVQELAMELADAPEERRAGGAIGMDTAAALRERQRMAAREAVEEELMVRVPLSKDERKRLRAQQRAGLSGKALLDDFADDLADILGGDDTKDTGLDQGFGRHKLSQKYGADLVAPGNKHSRSGDADLPARDSLTVRRARMDGIRSMQHSKDNDGFFDEFMGGKGKRDREPTGVEDETYVAAKERLEKKKQKRQDKQAPSLYPPMADATLDAARKINTAIEKNRGLTPHRRRDMKNPRKKHRTKFAEANVRRRGQVQETKTAGVYGGEQTGIKSRVSKSVKL